MYPTTPPNPPEQPFEPTRSFVKKTATVTAVSIGARGVGFLVPFFIAAWFGATAQTDVLFFVYALALFISNVLAPVLESLSVPFIAERRGQGKDVPSFVASLALIALVGTGVLSGLLAVAALPLLPHVTAFGQAHLDLAMRLLLLLTPLIPLTSLSSVFVGALNSSKRFYFPAASPLLRASVNLLVIWALKPSLGVSAVAVGYVIGEGVRASALFLVSARGGLVSWPSLAAEERRSIGEFLRVGTFQAIGGVSIGLVPLTDRAMASWLSRGSVSLLEYSDRLYQIPVTLLGAGLVVTTLSRWSSLLHSEGRSALEADVRSMIPRVTRIGLFLTAAFAAASALLVGLVYRASLTTPQKAVVTGTLLAYLLGVAPFVVGQMYNRVLLALKQTRFLLAVTIIANFFNVLFNLLMMRLLGVAGLALSSSATALVVVFVLRNRVNRELGSAEEVEMPPAEGVAEA